jgi:hypothetical protein
MGLRCKVHHPGNGIAGKQVLDQFPVGHVPLDESIMGIAGKTAEILGVAGVSQQVQVEDVPLRLGPSQKIEEIGADEPRPPGYQDITHKRSL